MAALTMDCMSCGSWVGARWVRVMRPKVQLADARAAAELKEQVRRVLQAGRQERAREVTERWDDRVWV